MFKWFLPIVFLLNDDVGTLVRHDAGPFESKEECQALGWLLRNSMVVEIGECEERFVLFPRGATILPKELRKP